MNNHRWINYKHLFFLHTVVCFLIVSNVQAEDVLQFRGSKRNGSYSEKNILQKWPEQGPRLITQIKGLGDGYSSPAISQGKIYITGVSNKKEFLYSFDKNGKIQWKTEYGNTADSYPGSRSTPTVEDNFIYLTSGAGEVVCFNKSDGSIKWKVNATEKFKARYGKWEVAESLLLFDGKVIFTPCGLETAMVALDALNGETVWMSEALDGTAGYASPILINRGGKDIIITLTEKYMIGVNAKSGKLLWKVDFSELSTSARWKGITAPSPLYHDGRVFFTSGYDQTAVMLELAEDGNSSEVAWVSEALDNHHGNVVYVDGYIYGSNWINNQRGNWVCLDWQTGKVMYETKWHTKGSVIANEGFLYCYEEKSANIALVKASPEKFDIISTFKMTEGKGPCWAHPVISNQKLYIRRGDVLNIFDIKA